MHTTGFVAPRLPVRAMSASRRLQTRRQQALNRLCRLSICSMGRQHTQRAACSTRLHQLENTVAQLRPQGSWDLQTWCCHRLALAGASLLKSKPVIRLMSRSERLRSLRQTARSHRATQRCSATSPQQLARWRPIRTALRSARAQKCASMCMLVLHKQVLHNRPRLHWIA